MTTNRGPGRPRETGLMACPECGTPLDATGTSRTSPAWAPDDTVVRYKRCPECGRTMTTYEMMCGDDGSEDAEN